VTPTIHSDEDLRKLGLLFWALRKDMDVKLRRLASAAHVSRQYLRDLEHGKAYADGIQICRIARELLYSEEQRVIVYDLIRRVCSKPALRPNDLHVDTERRRKLRLQRLPKNVYRYR